MMEKLLWKHLHVTYNSKSNPTFNNESAWTYRDRVILIICSRKYGLSSRHISVVEEMGTRQHALWNRNYAVHYSTVKTHPCPSNLYCPPMTTYSAASLVCPTRQTMTCWGHLNVHNPQSHFAKEGICCRHSAFCGLVYLLKFPTCHFTGFRE